MTTSGRLCGPVALCRKERQREGPTCRATRAPRNLSLYTQNSKRERQKLPNPRSDSVGFPSSLYIQNRRIYTLFVIHPKSANLAENRRASQVNAPHTNAKIAPPAPALARRMNPSLF